MDDLTSPPTVFASMDNPAPPDLILGRIATLDGATLRYARSPSAGETTRGTILLLQGRNEAIEKYFETITDLNRLGFAVLAFDWRGQGGSSRHARAARRGHVRRFDNYLNDLNTIVQSVLLPDCRAPYAVLAHSMGGLVALAAAPRLANVVERMVLGAPLVALRRGPISPGLLGGAARLAALFGLGALPVRPASQQTRATRVADSPLTSDPHRFARNHRLQDEAPHLFLDAPSAAWLAAVSDGMRRLDGSDRIARLAVPTLFVLAGADRIVDNAASERLAHRMRAATSIVLPHARHELLQEADRYRLPFLDACEAFLTTALPQD